MDSNFVICFITNEYIKSKSCRLEFYYANNNDKKCIYILLENIERKIANGINMYLFGDALRFDAFKQKKETLNEYANEIFSHIKNSITPNFSSPYKTNSLFEISRNEEFLARDGLMEKIEMVLNNKKKLCLFGYPGVGLSACTTELAYRLIEKYNQKIIWIDAGNKTKILKSILDFIKIRVQHETDIEILKTEFLYYVNSQEHFLIFNGLENIDDLKNIFKLEMIKTSFVITTRLNKIGNIDMIEILPFNIEEADRFLKKVLPQLPEKDIKKIISEYVNNEQLLPCKLSMIAGVLNQEFEKTVEKVLNECRHDRYTGKIIDELINAKSNDSVKLLMIASLIDPDYISFEFIKQFKWEKPIKEAIQKLSNFNLLTRVYSNSPKYGLRMHRIFIKDFREYFESQNNNNLRIDTRIKEEIIDILNKSIHYVTYEPTTAFIETNKNLVFHAIEILKEKETNVTLITSELFEKIGEYYENEIQDYNTAFIYEKRGIEIKRKIKDKIDSSLAQSFEKNAQILWKIGNDKESLENNKRALEIREKLYYGNHPDTARSLNDLGVSYSRLGDERMANDYFKRALNMREKIYSGDHPDTARSLIDLAVSNSKLGDERMANDYFKKALNMREKIYSGDHPDTARSLNDLAVSYSRLGDERMANDYFKKAMNMRQFLYADDQPDLKVSIDNLAGSSKRLHKT